MAEGGVMAKGESMRLAVVDDHELVREGLVALLSKSEQPPVDVTYSGFDISHAIESNPDIALLDVDLGAGSDPVVENITRFVDAQIAVLLISSSEEAMSIKNGLNAGALGFVPKRVSYHILIEALKQVNEGEIFLSVDLAAILTATTDKPDLSPRELDALRLYASGLTLNAVARQMRISPHTAKEYLDRVRNKYGQIGREARTRTELYVAAQDDGLLQRPSDLHK
jgi:DNA-binding NarL/FixJ family response regulator